MAKIKFTRGRIAAFKCKQGTQSFLWCDTVPGLAVRATASGVKSYIFQAKISGKTMRVTIGSVLAWGIDEAQAEARRLQIQIDSGNDPRQVKADRADAEAARIAAKKAAKLEAKRTEAPALDAWNAYMKARRPKWGKLTIHDHERVSKEGGEPVTRGRKPGQGNTTQPGILRPLLLLPLAKITAPRMKEWLADEAAKRPTHAALGFRLLRAFLNWCNERVEYQGQVSIAACSAKAVRDELPRKASKDDCLQREQLPLWFEYVRKLSNPVHSAYLQSLLLTGARREELAGLKWSDVDFQWNSLKIHDKTQGERVIPLTPYVSLVLASLPHRNGWVFSSPTAASGRLMEPRIGHNKALAAAGLPALTLHGLRRSFGTLAEWVECPAGVSAQIMGHAPSAIAEKHYRRRPLDLLRQWHTKIEGWILEQAGIEQPATDAKAGLKVV